MFQAPKLTNAGKALYYANMGGAPIKITTIQMGRGTLSGPIASMSALVEPVVVMDAFVESRTSYVDVSGKFSNAALAAGFYWREIGVFAENPDDPENRKADILFCYQNAFDTADFIPVASVETVEKNITVPIIVGDATTVSCLLDKSLVFATVKDLESAVSPSDEKGTPSDADSFVLTDDSAGGKKKRLTWESLVNALPAVDVTAQIAAHDADETAHANLGFLRGEDAEPGAVMPNDADTLEGKTLAEIEAGLEGALTPKAHTHTKEQVTDFAHKASHGIGGADALTAGDIGAAGVPLKLVLSVPVGSWAKVSGCFQQTVAAAGLLATDDLHNARLEPVGNAGDAAAQKLTDEAYSLLAGPGGYAACTVDGQLFLRCPKEGAKPGVTFQIAVCIVR